MPYEVNITNEGGMIKVTKTHPTDTRFDEETRFNKGTAEIDKESTDVHLGFGDQVVMRDDTKTMTFGFDEVLLPVAADVDDLIDQINAFITAGSGVGATEATLLAILAEQKDDVDFEVKLAKDTVTDLVYCLRIEKEQDTGVVTQAFYDIAGVLFVPINPMVFIDPTTTLALILTELSSTPHTSLISTNENGTGPSAVAAGASAILFENQGVTDAVVNGEPIKAGGTKSFTATFKKTLPAVTFDDSGVDLIVSVLLP